MEVSSYKKLDSLLELVGKVWDNSIPGLPQEDWTVISFIVQEDYYILKSLTEHATEHNLTRDEMKFFNKIYKAYKQLAKSSTDTLLMETVGDIIRHKLYQEQVESRGTPSLPRKPDTTADRVKRLLLNGFKSK